MGREKKLALEFAALNAAKETFKELANSDNQFLRLAVAQSTFALRQLPDDMKKDMALYSNLLRNNLEQNGNGNDIIASLPKSTSVKNGTLIWNVEHLRYAGLKFEQIVNSGTKFERMLIAQSAFAFTEISRASRAKLLNDIDESVKEAAKANPNRAIVEALEKIEDRPLRHLRN